MVWRDWEVEAGIPKEPSIAREPAAGCKEGKVIHRYSVRCTISVGYSDSVLSTYMSSGTRSKARGC
jgi:hypothetical protein